MSAELEEQKNNLILQNNKKNRIGWFLELPATIFLFLAVILMFTINDVTINLIITSILLSLNFIYLVVHLIYFTRAYITHSNVLGKLEFELNSISFNVVDKHTQSPDHYQKCSFCGYSTPNQFKKCSHCGAVL